jgi:hypothetical protein
MHYLCLHDIRGLLCPKDGGSKFNRRVSKNLSDIWAPQPMFRADCLHCHHVRALLGRKKQPHAFSPEHNRARGGDKLTALAVTSEVEGSAEARVGTVATGTRDAQHERIMGRSCPPIYRHTSDYTLNGF